MRKRQKPYLLITILVITGATVAVLNTPPKPPENPQAQQQEQTPETGKQAGDTKVDPKSIGNEVAEKMKASAGGGAAAVKSEALDGPEGKNDGPLVLKQDVKPQAPTPNPSATSQQWYTNETPQEIPKVKVGGPPQTPSKTMPSSLGR